MPSPKSGSKVSTTKPAAPTDPKPTDPPDPGEALKLKAEQQQSGSGKHGEPKAEPLSGSSAASGATAGEQLKKLETLEVQLVDADGKPVPGEPYELLRGDAPVTSGTLDADGRVIIASLEPGSYTWKFPKLHKDAWKKA